MEEKQFTRALENSIMKGVSKQKVSLIVGARRTGKSELLKSIEKNTAQ